MFRRPLPAGNQCALGNRDRKKLREALLRSFSLLTAEDVDVLLQGKEGMAVVKMNLPQASPDAGGPQQPSSLPPLMSASSANKCSLYVVDELPVVAEVNGLLFPTVHGLWRVPKMLPCILVLSPVSCFVLKGADLMLPGVCRPLTAAAAAASGIESLIPGQLWAVRVAGNALPFAVGRAVARAPSLGHLGDKGRAIEIVHHLGDALWKHGKAIQLPPLFTLRQVFSGRDDAELLASCGMGPPEALPGALQQEAPQEAEEGAGEETPHGEKETPTTSAVAAEDEEDSEAQQQETGDTQLPESGQEASPAAANCEKPSMTPEEMDGYLDLCLLETLHSLSDEQLPLDISALYSKLTAEAPAVFFTRVARGDTPYTPPDIRRSSSKKLGKFVQTASKRKLFQTKEQRGVVSIVKVNRSHPDYVKFTPVPEAQTKKLLEKAEAAAAAAAAATTSPTAAGAGHEDGGFGDTPTAAGAASSSSTGPIIYEFCVPPAKCCKVFAGAGVPTGKYVKEAPRFPCMQVSVSLWCLVVICCTCRNIYFTAQEYRDVLSKYLEARNAKREDGADEEGGAAAVKGVSAKAGPTRSHAVALDPLLAEAVLTKNERGEAKAAGSEPKVMEKGELFQRWQETQQPCHAVLRNNAELPLLQDRIVKGACLPIRLSVEDKFGGRKHATHIFNLGNFLLEPKLVADFLQKKLASSASVYAPPGCKTTSAVCIQGNVTGLVAEQLISYFGIPKKYIEIEAKKPKVSR